jgi:hypothetical protein
LNAGIEAIQEKIKYIHQNPVEAGLVYFPEDYVYSRASDYAGRKGYLDDVVIFECFGEIFYILLFGQTT